MTFCREHLGCPKGSTLAIEMHTHGRQKMRRSRWTPRCRRCGGQCAGEARQHRPLPVRIRHRQWHGKLLRRRSTNGQKTTSRCTSSRQGRRWKNGLFDELQRKSSARNAERHWFLNLAAHEETNRRLGGMIIRLQPGAPTQFDGIPDPEAGIRTGYAKCGKQNAFTVHKPRRFC